MPYYLVHGLVVAVKSATHKHTYYGLVLEAEPATHKHTYYGLVVEAEPSDSHTHTLSTVGCATHG